MALTTRPLCLATIIRPLILRKLLPRTPKVHGDLLGRHAKSNAARLRGAAAFCQERGAIERPQMPLSYGPSDMVQTLDFDEKDMASEFRSLSRSSLSCYVGHLAYDFLNQIFQPASLRARFRVETGHFRQQQSRTALSEQLSLPCLPFSLCDFESSLKMIPLAVIQ